MLKKEAVFRPPSNIAENAVKDQWCHYYQNLVQNMVCVCVHIILCLLKAIMQAGVHETFQKLRSLFKMVGVRSMT